MTQTSVARPEAVELTGPTTVVIGPKTRLGAAVLAQATARGEAAFALARDAADASVLAAAGHTVLSAGTRLHAADATPWHLVVCALGPVHTWQTDIDADAVRRELDAVDALLAGAPAGARLTYVSSVIALAPGPDRRHYAGWKLLIEHRLREIAAHHRVEVSVVHPGRLVEPGDIRRLWHRLHTKYSRLATLIEQVGRQGAASKVVGLDARLWLVRRAFSVGASSVSGAGGSAHSSTSEGPVTRNQEISS